jgi:PAS domain S-box-containing protein
MPVNPKDIRALRQKAEKALREAPGKPALTSGTDLTRLTHELAVHQIELEMQNEELRRSQEELERSHAEYADLYDFAPVGYLTFDRTGLVTKANLTACNLLGIERSLFVKKPFALFVHPESQDAFHICKQTALETTTTQTCQLVMKRNKGAEEYFHAQLESIAVLSNGATTVRTVLTDITERKRAEEALKRQANLLELAHCAIFVRDLENRITFWNHRAEEVYGWTKPEAMGNAIHAFLKARFPVPFREYMAILTKEGRWEGELVQVTKAGRQITVLSRQAVQRDDSGNPLAILEINLDVTEARRIEQELRQAHKMEALGTLTSGIAHDFNNILASIIGFTELAEGRAVKGNDQEHLLRRVMEAGLRGRELVKQLLTYSRKSEQEKVPLQLGSLVRETMNLLRASTPSTINIRVKVDNKSGFILADPAQMQQVLMNLCANAAHAMREHGGTLDVELGGYSLSASDEMGPGPYLRLVVRDTGVGMPADIRDKVFDPFFTTKEQGEGTGLGLSIVHGIVKQHDGYITVESEPGKGSTFTVYFPMIAERPKASTPGEGTMPTGRERILFIDDEEALAEMGQEILSELGYQVESKTGSREALAILRLDPSRFDLVVTDQTMPEMTGIELAGEILAIRPDMPVILCTGFSHTASEESAKAAGIKAFVLKPLTKREIARTVRRVLDEHA